MDQTRLIIDLFRPLARLGPGSEDDTLRALELAGLRERSGLRVADLGCGTGASALTLAGALDAHVTAVDAFPEFVRELERRAEALGLGDRVTALATSFDALPFAPGSLDVVWSEGAIYNIGFEAGVEAWTRLLAPGGILAVSEITWLTHDRPAELHDHWTSSYPEIDTASAKLGVLERHGLTPVGYFPLPASSWTEDYYGPLRARFAGFVDEYDHAEEARALVELEEREIALFERHSDHYSYGFYIARKR